MKKRQRRSFSAEMKSRIALEAIKGQKTIQEIASHYGVHPNQVTNWKRQAVEGLDGVRGSAIAAGDQRGNGQGGALPADRGDEGGIVMPSTALQFLCRVPDYAEFAAAKLEESVL